MFLWVYIWIRSKREEVDLSTLFLLMETEKWVPGPAFRQPLAREPAATGQGGFETASRLVRRDILYIPLQST